MDTNDMYRPDDYGQQQTGKLGRPYGGPPPPGYLPPPGPPQQPKRPGNLARGLAIGIAFVFMLGIAGIVLAGNSSVNPPQRHHAAGTPGKTHSAAPVANPVPADPSPAGTLSGSCDYTLGYPAADHFVGEVDLHNTGNIGTVVDVTIKWPQEGSPFVTMHRTVRTAAGSRTVVRFRKAVTETQVSLLQSWQERHGFKDGCKYDGNIINEFGSVSP